MLGYQRSNIQMIKSDGWRNSLLSEVVRSIISWTIIIDCTRYFTEGNHSSVAWLDKHRSSKSLIPNNPIICLFFLFWNPLIVCSAIQILIFADSHCFYSESTNFSNICKNILSRSPPPIHTHKVLWRKLGTQII